MLGPRSSGPCTQSQQPAFAFLSRAAQSYHGWVWADPANPASLCGHVVSLGPPPLIQSCSSHLHTGPIGGRRGGGGNLRSLSLSLSSPKIPSSLIQLDMNGAEQVVFQGGILDCACCPSPSCRDGLCVTSNEDLTERRFPSLQRCTVNGNCYKLKQCHYGSDATILSYTAHTLSTVCELFSLLGKKKEKLSLKTKHWGNWLLIGDTKKYMLLLLLFSFLNKPTPQKCHVSHRSNCLFVFLCAYLVHLFSMYTNIDQASTHLLSILTDEFNEEHSVIIRGSKSKSNFIQIF